MRILEPAPAALALLAWCVVLPCRLVNAQINYDPQLVQQKAHVCVNPAQQPAERVAACTRVIDGVNLAKGSYAMALDERADALNALGRREEAIADYTRAIALAPRDVIAYSNRATLYLASDRLDLGIADLTQVIGIEPTNSKALYNRGVAYQRSGATGKALDDFRTAAHLSPPFAPAQVALETLEKADRPQVAAQEAGIVIGDYATVMRSADLCADPAQPPAARVASCTLVMKQTVLPVSQRALVRDNRANALMALGKHDEALADLSDALKFNPRDAIALASRATLYLDMNQPDLAREDLDKLKLINPQNGIAFYNAGVTEQASGAVDKALDDYRTAVRLLPSFAPAHAALGVLLKVKDPNAALAEFNQALDLDPQSPALSSRASLTLSLGQFDQSIRDFDALIGRDSSNSLAYLNRAVAEEQLGDLDKALNDYSRGVEIAPSANAYFARANLYVQLYEPEKALADFNAALAIDPKNIRALEGRADLNYGAKRLAASRDDYTRVIAAQPANAEVFFRRGSVYFDMGDFAAALRDYSASLALNPNQPDVLRQRTLAAKRLGNAN